MRDLKIPTLIGIYDWERQIRQTLHFDLEMAFDIRPAAASDDIADALNYKAVTKRIIEHVSASEYQLVEKLAESITSLVLDEFDVTWIKLTLNKKGALTGATDVGVIIERGEKG